MAPFMKRDVSNDLKPTMTPPKGWLGRGLYCAWVMRDIPNPDVTVARPPLGAADQMPLLVSFGLRRSPRRPTPCNVGAQTVNSTICQAIGTRAVIEFSYGGGHRVVEPHTHGISTAGNEVLRGYQVSGYSSSQSSPFWRLFDVSRIHRTHRDHRDLPDEPTRLRS